VVAKGLFHSLDRAIDTSAVSAGSNECEFCHCASLAPPQQNTSASGSKMRQVAHLTGVDARPSTMGL
jgi:hypothetical protein